VGEQYRREIHGWGKVLYHPHRKLKFSLLESPEKQESHFIPRKISLKACKELPPSHLGVAGKSKASNKRVGEGRRNLETKRKARAHFVLARCLVHVKLKVSRARPLPAACSHSTARLPLAGNWPRGLLLPPLPYGDGYLSPTAPARAASPSRWWKVATLCCSEGSEPGKYYSQGPGRRNTLLVKAAAWRFRVYF